MLQRVNTKGTKYSCLISAFTITSFLLLFLYHHLLLSPIDHVYFFAQPISSSSFSSSPSPSPSPSPLVLEGAPEEEENDQSWRSPAPVPYENPSYHIPLEDEREQQKVKSKKTEDLLKVDKIENGLARARAAIREAALLKNYTTPFGVEPVSFVPLPRLYRNSYAFYRSHMEMAKRFKVWTYKEGEAPLFHHGPTKAIYGIEGQFIDEMDSGMNRFMARHPDEAHAFFLPFSLLKVRQFLLDIYTRDPMHRVVLDYVDIVSQRYPFWNTSLGADHFLLSCHDWAPDVSQADPELLKHVMRALCNANISEGFRPMRDISIPEVNIPGGDMLIPPAIPTRTRNRRILAFFAGGQHGYVRELLFKWWKENDDEIRVHEHLPKGQDYFKMMGQSRFCLCPSGYEVASPRIVEAIHTECVPVIISSNYSLPFADVLDWSQFSVSITIDEIPEMKRILKAISDRKYLHLVKGVRSVKWHFTLNRPSKPFDMIHMVLHSVWLRRLNIKLPIF